MPLFIIATTGADHPIAIAKRATDLQTVVTQVQVPRDAKEAVFIRVKDDLVRFAARELGMVTAEEQAQATQRAVEAERARNARVTVAAEEAKAKRKRRP